MADYAMYDALLQARLQVCLQNIEQQAANFHDLFNSDARDIRSDERLQTDLHTTIIYRELFIKVADTTIAEIEARFEPEKGDEDYRLYHLDQQQLEEKRQRYLEEKRVLSTVLNSTKTTHHPEAQPKALARITSNLIDRHQRIYRLNLDNLREDRLLRRLIEADELEKEFGVLYGCVAKLSATQKALYLGHWKNPPPDVEFIRVMQTDIRHKVEQARKSASIPDIDSGPDATKS